MTDARPPEPADARLLAQFAAGDREAARLLTLRHGPRIHALARRMLGDAAEAEDVTQETMLRLWRIAPDWQPGDGGELEIVESDDKVVLIEPIARRCVMFKSAEVLHGVLEAHKSRYSLTGWLLHYPAALGKFFG